MDRSLQALIARADRFASERARRKAKLATSEADAGSQGLLDEFPELAREESFAMARAGGAAALPLYRFLARFAEVWDARTISQELELRLRASVVPVAEKRFTFQEAVSRVTSELEGLLRGGLENGLAERFWELRDLFAERCRTAVRTAQRLGFPSYEAFQTECGLRPSPPDAAQVARFLRRTEDGFRDLLSYALKKVGAEPTTAKLHDALLAVTAPRLTPHFRREEALPTWSRWLDGWGFELRAQGRIEPELDLASLEGTAPRALAVEVPGSIKLLAPPTLGVSGYAALLEATGRAQHWAQIDPELPLERRRLIAPEALEASAQLFGGFLHDGGWLKWSLGLPPHLIADATKFAALKGLFRARRDCAVWSYQSEVFALGPEDGRAESYRAAMREALGVDVPRGFFLRDAEARHEVAARLTGIAEATALRRRLRMRFDEDFWRNPAAATWLRGQWNQNDATLEPAPSLVDAGDDWIRILNA